MELADTSVAEVVACEIFRKSIHSMFTLPGHLLTADSYHRFMTPPKRMSGSWWDGEWMQTVSGLYPMFLGLSSTSIEQRSEATARGT